MASQLAIELTLEQPASCIISHGNAVQGTAVPTPTYSVGNVNLIPEILEFDARSVRFIKDTIPIRQES